MKGSPASRNIADASATGAVATGASTTGMSTLGAVAVGALVMGAFALGALAASACVGAVLGLAGSRIDAWAVPVAALFALVGAAREGGFTRLPLPQAWTVAP